MASPSRRPLPNTPECYDPKPSDRFSMSNPYFFPYPSSYPPILSHTPDEVHDEPLTAFTGGTLLHKSCYDLLAMILTPSPSRLIWGPPRDESVLAGPRYEAASNAGRRDPVPLSPPVSPRKVRRISKDMVSKPTGFVHLVHASDADQLEAFLTRCDLDGLGKLGGPRWANPIEDRIRKSNQARAINEMVNALKSSQSSKLDGWITPLRVVNDMNTTTSSALRRMFKPLP